MRWKLVTKLTVTALFVAGMAWAGATERFSRASSATGSTSSNYVWVPTFNGETFRATKITFVPNASAGGQLMTCTVYLPLNSGPDSATDSLVLNITQTNGGGSVAVDYYGPISDTLRVVTGASMRWAAFAYK